MNSIYCKIFIYIHKNLLAPQAPDVLEKLADSLLYNFHHEQFLVKLKIKKLLQKISSKNLAAGVWLFGKPLLVVGDWTHAILFVGLCHMLSCCFIGQFNTIGWLLSGILGVDLLLDHIYFFSVSLDDKALIYGRRFVALQFNSYGPRHE